MFIPLKDTNPRCTFPFVTISLIVINVLLFIYQNSFNPLEKNLFMLTMAAIPLEITSLSDLSPISVLPPPLTILTSLFTHGGLLHITSNMLFLWIFGDNIEDKLGHTRFLLFYLACGTIAALTHTVLYPLSDIPLIGASGAIAGVLGAYMLLFPRARVVTLVFLIFFINIIEVRAIFFLAIWFAVQVFSFDYASGGAGVAWMTHIGGFLGGIAMLVLMARKGVVRVPRGRGNRALWGNSR